MQIERLYSQCRYCDDNIKMDSSYRRYSDNIPKYLMNRPSSFIKCCLEKRDRASDIPASYFSKQSMGKFTVTSISRNALPKEYKLSFGDDTAMPNCTCYDWRHSAYLCKHFFAVFNVFPNWSWEALWPVYRNSPFMTLDEEIQQHKSREILQDFEDSEQPDSQDDQDVLRHELGNDSSSSQQSPKSHEKCCGPLCRETLDEIRRLSFLVQDRSEILSETHETLTLLKRKLYAAWSTEKGLQLLPANTCGDEKRKKSRLSLQSLPMRKRKSQHVNRIGEKRDQTEEAKKFKIYGREIIPFTEKGVVGVIDMDGVTTFVSTVENCAATVEDPSENSSVQTDESVKTTLSHNEKPFIGDPLRCNLTQKDLSAFFKNRMLNDNVINVFQKMLGRDIQNASGLQDTVLGQNLKFKSMSHTPFVQIIHDGRFHWVALSPYGCQEGEVFLFDSLFSGSITQKVKQQICQIMKCPSDTIKVKNGFCSATK